MTIWLIEPHDPLIFRDGRPFGPTPGAGAHSLQFPFPSVIAGVVRTRAGLDSNGIFQFNLHSYEEAQRKSIEQKLEQLKKLAIRGPLLVQLPKKGRDITPSDWMVPAPKDAVVLPLEAENLSADQKEDGQRQIKQLLPLALPSGAYHNLKQKAQHLLLVGLQRADAGKPDSHTPHYWTWKSMLSWLHDPKQFQERSHELQALGHSGPVREVRTHVRMDTYAHVGQPGMLFSTSGMEFITSDTRTGVRLSTAQDLGLVVIVDDEREDTENAMTFQLSPGPGCIGGERRIINWRQSACKEPDCPDALIERIIENQACRLILLTPAHFGEGYIPSWITGQRDNVQLRPQLKAIAIDRPQTISGWDLAKRRPKETRRLAPAGTVLFLSFKESLKQVTDPKQAITEWIRNTWMHCISDGSQDRIDGFGLAVLGAWSDDTES